MYTTIIALAAIITLNAQQQVVLKNVANAEPTTKFSKSKVKKSAKSDVQTAPAVAMPVQAPAKPALTGHEGHNHDANGGHQLAVAPASAADETIAINELNHNFGKIPQGKPVTFDFSFTNIGSTELKIENVQASCGCTTPTWKAGPYKPKETGLINVGYNAAAAGPFTKTITITYNGTMSKAITISGEVYAAPATPAPENKGIQMLKNSQ